MAVFNQLDTALAGSLPHRRHIPLVQPAGRIITLHLQLILVLFLLFVPDRDGFLLRHEVKLLTRLLILA